MKKRKVVKLLAWLIALSMMAGSALSPISASAAKKPKLSKKSATLTVGKSIKLKLKNAKKKVKWSSSNKKVASVNAKGVVKALKGGSAKIIAKTAGKKYTCKITVKEKKNKDADSEEDEEEEDEEDSEEEDESTEEPSATKKTESTKKPSATEKADSTQTPSVTEKADSTQQPEETDTQTPSTEETSSTPARTKKPLVSVTISPVTEQPGETPAPSSLATVTPNPSTTNSTSSTYTISINVNKDWSTWSNHGKQFRLTSDGGATFITDLTQVENGTYDIYEGESDTNVNVTVNGNDTSVTINYFTVTFMDGNDKLLSPEQQVVVMGGKADRPEITPGKTGYRFMDWVTYNGSFTVFDFENTVIINPASIYASWEQDSSIAAYTAEYYFQNIENDDYPTVASKSDQLEGIVEAAVPSYGRSFDGFTALEQEEIITISGDGNTVVRYYYERNKYTLTWNTNGGTINDTDYTTGNVKYGTSIEAPENVTKSGYLFKGWNTTVADTMPAKELSYTAQWSVVATATPTVKPTATPTVKPTATPTVKPTTTPTVKPTATPTVKPTATPTVKPTATPTVKPTTTPTVKPTATPTVKPTATPTVKPTTTPTIAPTPTKTPTYTVSIYVNKDWSTWSNHGKQFQLTADGGATFITDLTQVENGTYDIYEGETDTNINVTVNGYNTSCTINYFTVTFMDGNDKLSSPVQQVVVMGGNATRPETTPGKTGYSFVDWVTYNGSTTAFDFENTTINNATSIYASWKQNSSIASYTAEYYFQNIDDDGYPTVASESEQLEGLVESTVPSYGKDFAGFTALEQTENITISGDGNTVVKYYYERNKYTLTWNTNGGTINDTDYTTGSVKYGTTIKAPANVTKSGYLFKGWNTTVADTMPTNSLSYTAQWSVVATATPTVKPTATPTVAPTATPTVKPTTTPTVAPTATPTVKPTVTPTVVPTATPTVKPTATPTVAPTATPTVKPTTTPTVAPTATPTVEPTATPTVEPTPTKTPTYAVSIYVNKDWSTWSNHGKVFQLTADGGGTFITDLTQVENGTYDIYEGESDTNVNVTVNGNNTSVTVYYLTVTFMDGNDKLSSPEQQVVVMGGKADRPETVPGKTGYSFVDWVTYNGSSTAFDFENTTFNNTTSIYASWKQNSSKAAYTAEYYFQNIEDDGYPTVASESEQLEGLVESTVPSYGKDFAGFTALEQTENITISGDGNTVVKYYYERNKYTLTWNTNGGTINDTDYTTGSVKYGTTIKAPANVTKSGYLFKGWNTTVADTMPTNSLSYTAQWSVVATATPTVAPTVTPTVKPTTTPTVAPTATPTVKPTATPTVAPTATPTVKPTTTPTAAPTATATATPTVKPTTTPTPVPTPTAVPTSAEYTINYYLENLNDDGYTLAEYGIGRGSTGADVKVTAKSIEGFSVNTKLSAKTQTITIAADGSSVVNFYYKRNRCSICWYLDGGNLVDENDLQIAGTYYYDEDFDCYWLEEIKWGTTVNAPELKKSGYQVAGWYDYYEIDAGTDPSDLEELSSFTMTDDLDGYEIWPVWEEGGEVDPEEPEEPTEIIISDVALGMTVSELQAVLGTQIRKDVTPQGYDAYVFNPSENCEAYENYIIVYVDGDTVVGWATMSEHYSYGDIVSVGDSASSLSNFDVMDNYDYEAAYVYESSDAYIMAFVDHQSSNKVYAVQVYGKTDGSGNAVELDNLMLAENIKSNYTSEIYEDMAYQMFEWVNAFRYSQGVALVQYENNTTAQNHSVYMSFVGDVVTSSSDGTSWTQRFETNYKSYLGLSSEETLGKAENLGAGSPDAFGFVTWWIDDTDSASADGTSKMRNNICKTQTDFSDYYICTGFAHNANMKHVTFATMDIFY